MKWQGLALDTRAFTQTSWHWLHVPRSDTRAGRRERLWRWPVLLALLVTIPAFYAELLLASPPRWAAWAYVLASATVALALYQVSRLTGHPVSHLQKNPLDLLLIGGMAAAAALPPSSDSSWALGFRLVLAFMTLWRMIWSLRHLITRGGLGHLMIISVLVLGACGVGFWWIEPTTPDLGSGLWLAFTTAATVGYGDLVPTTPAARIFAVFVVLLGYGVLTLVTAAIASRWVESGERRIEQEFLHDMRREIAALRQELAAIRAHLPAGTASAVVSSPPASERESVRLDLQQTVEDE
ncbi:potassium channel family protein [Ideonella sp. DXS29W]|uniref:Potassium channel family protein n=1 Tax=Ideonella lacteola TaxID=2984193 RepID=A0ABU9BQ99_9BURK